MEHFYYGLNQNVVAWIHKKTSPHSLQGLEIYVCKDLAEWTVTSYAIIHWQLLTFQLEKP